MGLYDRDYTRADYKSKSHYAPQMRMAFPKITPVVKWLLIINVAVYFVQILGADTLLVNWFAVYPRTLGMTLQIWRLITYQFLHGDFWHILINMLWFFFLGPTLERYWGGRKFLIFYLGCGAAGGLFYILLVAINFLPAAPMIGASGAILGVVAACAILFPQIVIYLFPLPVAIPIRVAALAGIVIFILYLVTRSANAGGHAAHLAGMAAGTIYVFSQSWRTKFKLKIQSDTWEKKMAAQRNLQLELDRILQKVHDSGVHSLTSKEKKILKQATKAEQTRNKL